MLCGYVFTFCVVVCCVCCEYEVVCSCVIYCVLLYGVSFVIGRVCVCFECGVVCVVICCVRVFVVVCLFECVVLHAFVCFFVGYCVMWYALVLYVFPEASIPPRECFFG